MHAHIQVVGVVRVHACRHPAAGVCMLVCMRALRVHVHPQVRASMLAGIHQAQARGWQCEAEGEGPHPQAPPHMLGKAHAHACLRK